MEISPEERFKRIAWSIASSSAAEGKGDALKTYNRFINKRNLSNNKVSGETHKTW
jgi:hypothetical protein